MMSQLGLGTLGRINYQCVQVRFGNIRVCNMYLSKDNSITRRV